jgi:fatty acid-binding protein DegV
MDDHQYLMGVVDVLPVAVLGLSPPEVLERTQETVPMDQYTRTLPFDFSSFLPTVSTTLQPEYLKQLVDRCVHLCAVFRSGDSRTVRAAVKVVWQEVSRLLEEEQDLGANRQALEEWIGDLEAVQLRPTEQLKKDRMFRDIR